MMWLLTFIRVTFIECNKKPFEKLSSIFSKAYDEAFGDNHAWLVRKSAQVAIMASSERKRLVEVVIGVYDEKSFEEYNNKFLEVLIPVHEALWKFYKENELTKL